MHLLDDLARYIPGWQYVISGEGRTTTAWSRSPLEAHSTSQSFAS